MGSNDVHGTGNTRLDRIKDRYIAEQRERAIKRASYNLLGAYLLIKETYVL